ncbi:hypothetical protein ACFVYD_31015 [Streptomyces sp. NPDC058301]|uniref:hypothetical protein n=1 Tax=Streptomyces sp. NPDC058301 TaxID=3346436 RepID=UPI0036E17168
MDDLTPVNNQTLLQFLVHWYGDPTSPHASPSESHTAAPRELIEWHQISTQWDRGITFQNYAVPLSELEQSDGMVLFWVESQGTWIWAYDPEDPDHLVYEREPSDEPAPWIPTQEKLGDFLAHATIMEAILGAPAKKTAEAVALESILSREGTQEIPFPSWNWPAPGTRILSNESWLAMIHPSGDPTAGYDVMLSARSIQDLAWVENSSTAKWRTYSESQGSAEPSEPLTW